MGLSSEGLSRTELQSTPRGASKDAAADLMRLSTSASDVSQEYTTGSKYLNSLVVLTKPGFIQPGPDTANDDVSPSS